MGDGCLLTDWLARLNDRFGTPSRAIVVNGVGIVALVVLQVSLDVLAEVASFVYLLTYGLVHVAVIRLRRSDEAEYDPEFRIPSALYPAVPVLGAVATFAIMTQMDPLVIAGGTVIVVIGAAWYYLYVRAYQE